MTPAASAPDHPPAVPLAQVERGGAVEAVHLGHLVVTGPDGEVLLAAGDPDLPLLARSALKPLQLAAMLEAGLWAAPAVPPAGALALAAASHGGEPVHLAVVRAVLAAAGLAEDDLENTPDLPLHAPSAARWQAEGGGPSSLAQNCSGGHAAMLATCLARGWPTTGYLAPDHPLQAALLAGLAQRLGGLLDGAGRPVAGARGALVTTDGCGAPLPSVPLVALARAYGALARPGSGDAAAARVGAAMAADPHLLGGQGRPVTLFGAGVPGLVAKDGAEGVFALALPDGRAAALKVADGSTRPFSVVVAAVLAALGVRAPVVAEHARVPVLGHGRPVGAVTARLDPAALAALSAPSAPSVPA